jgi:hypothetical protein
MVVILKKSSSKKELDDLLKKLKVGKPFDSKKHLGKLKINIDGLEYQKAVRDEWN